MVRLALALAETGAVDGISFANGLEAVEFEDDGREAKAHLTTIVKTLGTYLPGSALSVELIVNHD
jgi:hypothetical protein